MLAVSSALRGEVYAAAYRFLPRPDSHRAGSLGAAPDELVRGGSDPEIVVGEAPAEITRGAGGVDRPARHRPPGWLAPRRPAPRSGRARRRRTPGGSGSSVGAGVRPAGRSTGALGDGPWTPLTGFGRQSRLMRPRSWPSSVAASAIRGARPAFARRWTRPGRSGSWPTRARDRRLPHRPGGRRNRRSPESCGFARLSPPRSGPVAPSLPGSRTSASDGWRRCSWR